MRYLHILSAVASEPWALEKTKLIAMANFLARKAAGGDVPAEEVARITQKTEKEVRQSDGAVAILPIQGVIAEKMGGMDDISGGASTQRIGSQFRTLVNDPKVAAIVMDINSPGGVARSVAELAAEIRDSRGVKPIVAQVNSMAASAAYWIATQADEIVVNPSGQAGSIGVFASHQDISEAMAKEGIKETLIFSSKLKVLGNSLEPLSNDARDVIQRNVDHLAAMFVEDVAAGRNTTLKNVNENFGQGLTFNADELLKRGMVDRIATMQDTLSRFGVVLNPIANKARQPAPSATQVAAVDEALASRKRMSEWARKINDDEVPPPSEFEAILRDAGVSKSHRVRIASRLHGVLQSESGGNNAEVSSALERLTKAAQSFS